MEMMSLRVFVREPTDVAAARREATSVAQAVGFDEADIGRVALVATELATNVLKHAGGGQLAFGRCGDAVDVLALDKGPGMADVNVSLRDGVSTAGTRGEGLGAVRRQSDGFDIYSRPGLGTAVLARLATERRALEPRTYGGLCFALQGEPVSGDGWAVQHQDGFTAVMVADGLGHGLLAHEAAKAALAAFERFGERAPANLLELAHGALRPTRGAAVSVARVSPARVEFAGVGNVSGTVISATGEARKMISHNGTLGHVAKRFQSFDYPMAPGSHVVLASDGLGTSWSPAAYPGLMACDPVLVAGVLYRDFDRGRDDVTVVAVKAAA